MANLDSTLGAEQMDPTTAGKCVSPTSWSVLAFGIQLNKMSLFPWRRYKQFLEKPLMVGIGGFALQYFCNDLNGAVQRQGYGVITFFPYIVVFSIMFALSAFWWIIYGRRLESCQGLETLPRHRQDIQMNETQQPTQEIQRNETPQAGDVQMDQALQAFLIRPEEFYSLMDWWWSTRLGEMTRDEALGKMKQLVEKGNRRSRGISIESTADETRAVMDESLETRGDGSRRLSAGSIIDGTHNPVFPTLCPGAANSNNQARSLSHDGLVLKIPQNVNVGELSEIYDANLPGCRELHRRIEIGPEDGGLRKVLAEQILESLSKAWTLDKDSTIQLGSFAIFKYTDGGVKCWMLQEHWTPTILDIHRSSQNFLEVLTGERADWTIRGFNLRDATLRVATTEKSENVTNSHQYKTENGADLVLFKEPSSLPMFMRGVFLSASSIVQLEEGVSLKLHSQAIRVQRAFWISVMDAFIPRPWTVGMMAILSLSFHYLVAWHFATILPVLVATYVYLLQDHVPQQGTDVPIRGVAPVVEEFGNVTDPDSRTLSEENLAEVDMPIGQQGGPVEGSKAHLGDSSSASKSGTTTHDGEPLPGIQGLQIVGHAVFGGLLTVCGHSINGTTKCMFQWVRHYRNGTSRCIEGAAQPEYTVTADDEHTMLAVECIPMDERNRWGELVSVFANDSKWITCGMSCKEAAAENEQQTGKIGESQSQSGAAREKVFELTRPQQHVSTTMNKYAPQVRAWPELPKRVLTYPGSLRLTRISDLVLPPLSLAKENRVSQGGSINSGEGSVATRGIWGSAHAEPLSHHDDAKDEALDWVEVTEFKNPQQNGSPSKNKLVPQVYEIPQPQKQTLTPRSGPGTGTNALEDLVVRKGGGSMEARRLNGASTVPDLILPFVFAHLDNPADRSAVSRVCKQWKEVDSNTRKHVQIANCYSIAPAALSRRFPNLKSLKIKGQPRALEYGLCPLNWGGHAAPWIAEVARAYAPAFESLWLRRMQVTDEDLLVLAQSCPDLLTLKLEKCLGFSPAGLAYITANCRSLKVLFLGECTVLESDSGSEWLHELAFNNPNLEELNFQFATGEYGRCFDIDVNDLEAIVENCKSMRCLKVCEDVDVLDLERVVRRSSSLLELGTGNCARIGDLLENSPANITFPRSIVALTGLYELSELAVPMLLNMLANLKKLELHYTRLSPKAHCEILRHCVSLEVLWATNCLGDAGLQTVARTCKNLRRIRIEDVEGDGYISPAGIIPLAESCVKLEFLVLYVADLDNATMAAIGENCSVLKDCRFVLLHTRAVIHGLPLDEGVKSLLSGCRNLTRFALYVRHGALTDVGMGYIGEYGAKLKWILLGCTGESDLGLTRLASGCQSLEKLEMRDCPVTESGLFAAVVAMQNSLKFLWIEGRGHITEAKGEILARARPKWTVEITPSLESITITGYCSLAEPRTDNPATISVFRGRDSEFGTPFEKKYVPQVREISELPGQTLTSSSGGGSEMSDCDVIDIASPTVVAGLVLKLKSDDVNLRRQAARELGRLAKFDMENHIASSGAIERLVELLTSKDLKTQEIAGTALLKLSNNGNNKSLIAAADAIDPLVNVLKAGNVKAKEDAAATLFTLSVLDDNKVTIGASGAITPLVHLLKSGTPLGKKDAVRALLNLSMFHENKARIVSAGAIKSLVELMGDPATEMVDKAVAVLDNLATIPEGRFGIGGEGGIPALVEVIDTGSETGKENAAAALLPLCMNSRTFRALVLQEGAIGLLVALSESGTARAKEKASALLRYLSDEQIRKRKRTSKTTAEHLGLSEDEVAEDPREEEAKKSEKTVPLPTTQDIDFGSKKPREVARSTSSAEAKASPSASLAKEHHTKKRARSGESEQQQPALKKPNHGH